MTARAPPSFVFDPGVPWCGVCGKEVDRVVRDEDHGRKKLVVTVYCHGDVESAEIPEVELARNPGAFKFGTAFSRAPVKHAPPAPPATAPGPVWDNYFRASPWRRSSKP